MANTTLSSVESKFSAKDFIADLKEKGITSLNLDADGTIFKGHSFGTPEVMAMFDKPTYKTDADGKPIGIHPEAINAKLKDGTTKEQARALFADFDLLVDIIKEANRQGVVVNIVSKTFETRLTSILEVAGLGVGTVLGSNSALDKQGIGNPKNSQDIADSQGTPPMINNVVGRVTLENRFGKEKPQALEHLNPNQMHLMLDDTREKWGQNTIAPANILTTLKPFTENPQGFGLDSKAWAAVANVTRGIAPVPTVPPRRSQQQKTAAPVEEPSSQLLRNNARRGARARAAEAPEALNKEEQKTQAEDNILIAKALQAIQDASDLQKEQNSEGAKRSFDDVSTDNKPTDAPYSTKRQRTDAPLVPLRKIQEPVPLSNDNMEEEVSDGTRIASNSLADLLFAPLPLPPSIEAPSKTGHVTKTNSSSQPAQPRDNKTPGQNLAKTPLSSVSPEKLIQDQILQALEKFDTQAKESTDMRKGSNALTRFLFKNQNNKADSFLKIASEELLAKLENIHINATKSKNYSTFTTELSTAYKWHDEEHLRINTKDPSFAASKAKLEVLYDCKMLPPNKKVGSTTVENGGGERGGSWTDRMSQKASGHGQGNTHQ